MKNTITTKDINAFGRSLNKFAKQAKITAEEMEKIPFKILMLKKITTHLSPPSLAHRQS